MLLRIRRDGKDEINFVVKQPKSFFEPNGDTNVFMEYGLARGTD